MKAKDISGQAPGGKRTKLTEVLPLSTPFVVQIFPVYTCNFKCDYCHFSLEKERRCFVSESKSISIELYKKAIDDMCEFNGKIKTLRFVGMGEPTLHIDIVDMIRYAKKKGVADKVELLTNGSMIDAEMADGLINAELDRLVVSIQGVSGKAYQDISHVNIDFSRFISNLTYFYKHKKCTHVYMKVVDCALKSSDERKQFHDIFGQISDSIAVENTVPIFEGAKLNKVLSKKVKMTQFGQPISEVEICPQPYYTMQINPDGNIVGCHSIPYPEIFGNCSESSVVAIWNGKAFNEFRYNMLSGRSHMNDVCKNCNIMKYRLFQEDNISEASERLKVLYDKTECE